MNKKFTKLIAACALLVFMTPSLAGWGQTRTGTETTYTWSTKAWVDATNSWDSDKDGFQYNSSGTTNVQVTAIYSGAGAHSKNSISNITKISVNAATTSKGVGNIKVKVGNGDEQTICSLSKNTTYNDYELEFDPAVSGVITFVVNCSTNSMYMHSISVTTDDASGPIQLTTPTNFQATAGNGQAEFTWNAVSNASSYTISYTPQGGSELTATGITGTSHTITGLTNGTAYTCKIKAIGDGTNYSDSEYSDEISVTPTAAQQYTVTIADGITGGSVEANPTTATAGTTINVTATANDGYHLTALSYTDGSTTTDINTTTMQFTMPASDVTINATFTPYTVTLNANGSTSTWNVTMNGGNLPDAAAPCNTWSFYGWSTSAVGSQTTTAPTCVNGTGYTPEGNITLYAVYSKTEGSGSAFNGTTSTGSFLIYASVSANNSTTNYYAKGTGSKINSTTDASEATSYTFEQPTGYNSGEFAIKTGDNYITYSSSTNLGTSTTAYKWTVSEGTKGTWRVTSGTSGRALIFRAGTTNQFGGYSTSNVTANGTEYYDLEIGGASTTYYHSTPDCVETVATPTFDPVGGTLYETTTVHINCTTEGASIFYTLNGDEPTNTASETNFAYNAQQGISVSATTTIKAKAFKNEWNPSATATATYTVQHDVGEPLMEDATFTADGYEVTIIVPNNTTVYYTTDGTTPDNNCDEYDEDNPFTINATTTVKAIAYDGDGCASDVVTATFTRAYTLAGAKALYEGSNVTNVTISLSGVQFIAKSGSSTYMQQGTTGLMIYGSHSQDLTNGDVFTAGTVTGTITKYGENLELSISSGAFANVAKTAGTLTASATDVEITDVTGEFSTYESRYVALESLEMSVTDKTLSDGTNTLAIYDPFHVLDEAIQPDDDVIVTGVVTSYYKNSNTTYQIIPLAKSGITTGVAATLPTLDPVGGADATQAVSTETVIVTPATSTTVTYSFGSSAYGEIDAETEITVPSTEATELEVVASRDFYTDNSASYYYMSAAASYTVNFYENGELTYYEENVVSGTSLAISSTTAPNGYEFMGWTTSEITGVQSGAPATLYNGSVTVEDNMNLYAVYALEGEASVSYNKVDGYSSITEGTYLIAVNKVDSDNYNFANGQAASGHAGVEATGVATATSYTASDIPEGALEYTLAGNNTDGFSIHCSSGYLNATSAKASLSYGNTATETWIFSNKDGGLVLTGANNSSKASCNSTTAASAIRNYTSTGSHYDPLYFFKKAETPAYSNYCTTITYTTYNDDETRTTPILANEIVTVPNGTVLTLNTTNEGTAANLIIEDGGQLVTPNPVAATMKKDITGYNPSSAKTAAGDWYFISSPLNGATTELTTIENLIPSSGNYDLYAFDQGRESNDMEWRNFKNTENNLTVFNAGEGYLYANEEGQTIEFSGTVRATAAAFTKENLAYTAGNRFAGFNLVGNPFPCNATVSLPYYKMNSTSEGLNAVANAENDVIAPMEGVFVCATATGQSVTFTATTASVTAAASAKGAVNLNVESEGELLDRAIVTINGTGMLGKLNLNETATKLYITQNGKDYAVVNAQAQGEMPVNFKASKDGSYTITVDAENLEMDYLHLIDNMTGTNVDLLATPSYTFEAKTTDYASRFRLVFNANNATNEVANETFAFYNGSEWMISNTGNATLQVIDVLGRVLSSETISGTVTVSLKETAGVYMLRLVNGNDVKVQKIVVR